jgi:hypothetical protein
MTGGMNPIAATEDPLHWATAVLEPVKTAHSNIIKLL